MRTIQHSSALVVIMFAIGATAAHAGNGPLGDRLVQVSAVESDRNPLAERVRAANDRFETVQEAIKEGYSPLPCVSGPDGGGMGVHYVNAAYLKDDKIDLSHPEAVMYEPRPDGQLDLVAVEYITFKGPASLLGHLFNYNGAPNRYGLGPYYDLHVWAWRPNPKGTFAEMNPDVSCDAMPVAGQ